MSLYLRGSIWWSRIEVDGSVHQFSTKMRSKNQARSVEASKRTDLVKGLAGLSAPTLLDFSARFINSLPGRVSKQTYSFYCRHWIPLIHFKDLCNCRLDRITPAVVQDFVSWRRNQTNGRGGTITVTTVNHNLRTLRRALHLAAEWNVIAKVPKVRLLPGENQREYVLTEEAVQKFSKEAGLIGKIVPFLVDTGMRRRETCDLKWDGVNFDKRYIHITKGKTKNARRHIPFTTRVEQILKDLKATAETPYVFTIRKTVHITGDWLSHAFLDTRKKLKLPEECVLHSTRHTFCTRLGERGADAFAIQRLAGHSSIVISQRYVHPAAAKLDAAIALLE